MQVQQLPPEDSFQSAAQTETTSAGKFLYICDTLHLWEWDIRVLDIEDGVEGDQAPRCLGGRGAAPPEHCGGPTGYRLMLKRQRDGAAMSDPILVEAGIQLFAEA